MEVGQVLSLLLCIVFPIAAVYADRRGWLPNWLSTIVACYGIGILVSNLRIWPVDNILLENVAAVSMLIGLPLLLFAVRIRESLRYARRMLFAFALCCISGLFCTGVAGVLLAGAIPEGWKVAGMVVGLYTGGTPNVQAIGLALEAPADYLVLVQASDVLLGGAYLLGLITFLPAVYARFYPVEEAPAAGGDAGAKFDAEATGMGKWPRQIGAAVVVTALSIAACYLLTGNFVDPTVIILLVTSFSLAATLTSVPAYLGNSYPLGEYFVLIFCVALGLMADFRALAATGMDLLYFSAVALIGTTLLHLLLCKIFRLDRDTVILSYVAGLYGPVFVVQVAAAIRNQHLLAAGIAVSLLGFGIGNYLGIGLAYTLRWWLG